MEGLKDILDNLSESIVIVDGTGRIVMFNQEALRIEKFISGKTLKVGHHFTDGLADERRKTLADMLKTVKRQKKALKNFAEYNSSCGSRLFLEVTFVPVLGPKKEVKNVNIIAQDITSRKIFEGKMKTVASDVNSMIEHAHAIIFSFDSQGYIVEWNNHCTQITGFTKQEVLSRTCTDLLVNAGHKCRLDELMMVVMTNHPVANHELLLQTKTGGEIVAMVSATPRTNANGQVIGGTVVGQDITELTTYRKSLEKMIKSKTEALEQVLKKEKEAVEQKSRFVSIASHEFKSPLSSIDFATSFIKQNAATIGKKKLNEKVRVIEKHVTHMSHLLEDVLNFSRNENGKIKLYPSEISLETFIQDAVEEVTENTRHSHHICVSTNHLGFLLTDEKVLRNILINLLTNAIKYSPGKEEVSLNVLDHDDVVTLEVRDEGMGIPEDEIETIFEPFVRGKDAGAIRGTGLGLSIVKKAVELLNGNINVDSTPEKGSVFLVTIPRQLYRN